MEVITSKENIKLVYRNIIGMNKLCEITSDDKCIFMLWVGRKRLIKRLLFEKYLEEVFSV